MTPFPWISFGGQVIGAAVEGVGEAVMIYGDVLRAQGERAQIVAGYERRTEDWHLQSDQALLEGLYVHKQQLAAEIRLEIAKNDLKSFETQVKTAKEYEEVQRRKYTNDELYQWTLGEVAALYFQSYKLAYDMAKKAERAMQRELVTSDSFVSFGYWDSLHKGLLAGEKLQLDLKRMETAYLDANRREYELTKRVSLRQIDPGALLALRADGVCTFSLPEVLFDLDHPGHYMRRIKAVSLTIPAVTGPHTSLGAKLTLTQDRVRLVNFTDAGMPENYDAGDPIHSDARFAVGYGGTTAIATSHGRSDAGVFNLDFRDDRYLPFEGAGAISDWRLDLPNAVRQFDYDTISDVEIQIQYTARDGGAQMRGIVDARLATLLKNALLEAGNAGMLTLPLSGRAAFPVSLEKLLYPATGEEGQPVEVPIVLERFPYAVRQLGPRVKSVRAVFVLKDGATGVFTISSLLELTDPTPTTVTAGLHATNFDATFTVSTVSVTDDPWLFGLGATTTIDKPEEIKDLILLVDIDLP